MTSATTNHQRVNEHLSSSGDSITVPGGETWEVTITAAYGTTTYDGTNNAFQVQINNVVAIGGANGNNPTFSSKFILSGGDTVELWQDGGRGECHISGFVVNDSSVPQAERKDNTPVTRAVNGGSFTVPSGEVWKGRIVANGTDPNGTSTNAAGVRLNGNHLMLINPSEGPENEITEITLAGGDTVTTHSYSSISDRQNVVFTGYKVKE